MTAVTIRARSMYDKAAGATVTFESPYLAPGGTVAVRKLGTAGRPGYAAVHVPTGWRIPAQHGQHHFDKLAPARAFARDLDEYLTAHPESAPGTPGAEHLTAWINARSNP